MQHLLKRPAREDAPDGEFTIHHADCLEFLSELPTSSVDVIVTDF